MTSLESLDLDLNNYDLNDLLNLFGLNQTFNESELKRAYKTVLKTHPDKSGLDKKFFLFFSQAFKTINQIYEYKNKLNTREKCVSRGDGVVYEPYVDYSNINNTSNRNELEGAKKQQDKKIGNFLSSFSNGEQFNDWFNDKFNNVRLYNPETDGGHGSWLNDSSDDNTKKVSNINELHNEIQERKKAQRALVVHRDYEDMTMYSGSAVASSDFSDPHQIYKEKKDYSSSLDARLKYQDVKKAYTESVVPVTEQDYETREKYANVNALKQARSNIGGPMSEAQAVAYFDKRADLTSAQNTQRAYAYAQQMERAMQSQQKWNTYIQQITNG